MNFAALLWSHMVNLRIRTLWTSARRQGIISNFAFWGYVHTWSLSAAPEYDSCEAVVKTSFFEYSHQNSGAVPLSGTVSLGHLGVIVLSVWTDTHFRPHSPFSSSSLSRRALPFDSHRLRDEKRAMGKWMHDTILFHYFVPSHQCSRLAPRVNTASIYNVKARLRTKFAWDDFYEILATPPLQSCKIASKLFGVAKLRGDDLV